MNYFNKLPTINYNGYAVKNILTRAAISNGTRKNRLVYYPYTVKEDDRIDQISNNYYDSPGYMWLAWMSNNVVDPYYDLSLNDYDFQSYIQAKYGSVASAMSQIKFYRNNWYDNTAWITPAQYAALPSQYFKYYDPIVNNQYTVMAYQRKRHDDIANTNMVMQVTMASAVSYNPGDIFQIDTNNYATVISCNGITLLVQHVSGILAGSVNGINIVDTLTLSTTVAYTDALCWSPVTVYDYEHELNESKKTINLIDVQYRDTVESELTKILNA